MVKKRPFHFGFRLKTKMSEMILIVLKKNNFLSIDFPFTSKLKSNRSCLIKLKGTKFLPISRFHVSEIGQNLLAVLVFAGEHSEL